MKKHFWFFLISSFVIRLKFSEASVATSMSQIITNFYDNQKENIEIVILGKETEKLSEIVNDVVKTTKTISTIRKVGENRMILNQSAVLLFDSLKSYQDFHNKSVLGNVYPREFNILVYIDNFDSQHMSRLITKDPLETSSMFRHQSFLVHKNDELELSLITFVTFQQPNCRDWKVIEINQFSKNSGKWKSHEFFMEKFENFNGCELVIVAPYPQPPTLIVDFDHENGTNIWGYGVTFNEQISKNLNYKYIFNPHNLFTNEKVNTTLNTDFYIYSASIRRLFAEDTNNRVTTGRFTTTDTIIFVSRSVIYSQFDKIFLPFDAEVWYLLLATIASAVVLIFAMRFSPIKIRNFVLGKNVQTPLLNLM